MFRSRAWSFAIRGRRREGHGIFASSHPKDDRHARNYGDLHAQGRHGVEFYTETKAVVERWPKEWSRKF
jgi:hypothetical protein